MKTGVYQIRNVISGKVYIGSTQISFNKRKYQHFRLLRANKHHSISLQRAWNKHGEISFIFEILEECAASYCIEREQYYLDNAKPFYNINICASSRKGVKITDLVCLEKMRKAGDKGRQNLTLDGRKRISIANKGPKSKEHIKKVADKQKKAVIQLSKYGKKIAEYESAKEACKTNNWKDYTSIYQVCNSKRLYSHGFIWKYKTK